MHRAPALRARRLVCDASMVRSSRGYRSVGCHSQSVVKNQIDPNLPKKRGFETKPLIAIPNVRPTFAPRQKSQSSGAATLAFIRGKERASRRASHHPSSHRRPVAMASMTTVNLALGSRAAVRGAKVQQKRTVAAKKVAAAARAELSQGERPGESSCIQLSRRLETLRNRVRSRANHRPRR